MLWMCQEPPCMTRRDKVQATHQGLLGSSLLRTGRSGSSNRDHSKGFHYGDWNAELYSEVLAGAKEPSQGSEVSKDQ